MCRFIKTKLYGNCKVLKNDGAYYSLQALQDSFFYKENQKFKIMLNPTEIETITNYLQMDLL